jgi:hypothetical protein
MLKRKHTGKEKKGAGPTGKRKEKNGGEKIRFRR